MHTLSFQKKMWKMLEVTFRRKDVIKLITNTVIINNQYHAKS